MANSSGIILCCSVVSYEIVVAFLTARFTTHLWVISVFAPYPKFHFSSSDSWHWWPIYGEIVCTVHACHVSLLLTCTGTVIKPNNRKENSSFPCTTAAADNKKQTPERHVAHFSGDLIRKNRKDPDFCVCFVTCCLPSLTLLGFRD